MARPKRLQARRASLLVPAPRLSFFRGPAFLRGGMMAWAPRFAMASRQRRVSWAPSAATDPGARSNRLAFGDLRDQIGQHGGVADAAAGDLDGSHLHRRLGHSPPHLLSIVGDLRERGAAFRSLTESMDTASPQGELLLAIFGALAQYEHALIRERVVAGLRAAEARGRLGGRPRAISEERFAAIRAALAGGLGEAAAGRTFGVRRTTLIEALRRAG